MVTRADYPQVGPSASWHNWTPRTWHQCLRFVCALVVQVRCVVLGERRRKPQRKQEVGRLVVAWHLEERGGLWLVPPAREGPTREPSREGPTTNRQPSTVNRQRAARTTASGRSAL